MCLPPLLPWGAPGMCGAGQGWAGLSRERIHPRLPQGARQRGGLRRPCAVPAGAGQEPRALPEGLPGLRALPAAGPPRWLELGGPPVVVAAAWVIYSLLLLSVEREEKKKKPPPLVSKRRGTSLVLSKPLPAFRLLYLIRQFSVSNLNQIRFRNSSFYLAATRR